MWSAICFCRFDLWSEIDFHHSFQNLTVDSMVMYYVYMKLPVGDHIKRSQSLLGVLVYKIWGGNFGLGIITSHDFVENLLKTAEPTCDQPCTLICEVRFISSAVSKIWLWTQWLHMDTFVGSSWRPLQKMPKPIWVCLIGKNSNVRKPTCACLFLLEWGYYCLSYQLCSMCSPQTVNELFQEYNIFCSSNYVL